MTDRDSELDDLLQPTVQEEGRSGRPLPWRLQSQFWVAFFGGSFGVTAIALLNAVRLGLEAKKRWMIVLAGVVALAVTAAAFSWTDTSSEARIAGRIIAVLLFLVLRLPQKRADDHHQIFRGGKYASLWGPGIAASIAGGLVNYGLNVWIRGLQ